jgi:hypothetical protein
MTIPLRLLTLASTHTLPCRRLLLHTQFIAPHLSSFSFPLTFSDKSISWRAFVSTQPQRADPAPTPSTTSAILRRSPTVEDIESAELDVELPSQSDVQLAFTERAAEVCRTLCCFSGCSRLLTYIFGQQLHQISCQDEHSGSALQISVESGGCHGYQYKMELTRQRAPED